MKKFFKQLKKEQLSKQEKEIMKNGLYLFMEKNPIASPANETPSRIDFFAVFKTHHRFAFVGATLVIILLVMSGTAYAAEESLPGDLLYPIKINVTEKVRTALIKNPERLATWEAKKTERRLEEIEKITARGNFDQEKQEQLEDNLSKQAEITRTRIERLENNGSNEKADRIGASLEKSLEKYRLRLENIERKSEKIENKLEDKEKQLPEKNMTRRIEQEETKTREMRTKAKEKLEIKIEKTELRVIKISTTTEREPEEKSELRPTSTPKLNTILARPTSTLRIRKIEENEPRSRTGTTIEEDNDDGRPETAR